MSKEFDFLSLANEYDFSSDNINVFLMVLDSSGSMEDDTFNVRKGLEATKKILRIFMRQIRLLYLHQVLIHIIIQNHL